MQLPQAAAYKIELLHQLGDFETAMQEAQNLMQLHPEHAGLAAAVSVLALDMDQPSLAAACAAKAKTHPDARVTQGTLALVEQDISLALSEFQKAIQLNEHRPRAWVGLGLAQVASGIKEDMRQAADNLDRGASLFETHIGSWIAAGWTQLLLGELEQSRIRFNKAMEIDKTFAESHGALAVLDILEEQYDSAQTHLRRALGLDRMCYSAALAQTLLLNASGKEEQAREIFDKAINTPLDDSGRTISTFLVSSGLGR